MKKQYDLLVVGGGINGCGIAADASIRGLSVLLCEKGDLASATSSASTKLIHGGLRYLEQFKLKLVKKSLNERHILQNVAPNLIKPVKFIMPMHPQHSRNSWLIRAGLFLYDNLASNNVLPKTQYLHKSNTPIFNKLSQTIQSAFSYYDCSTDDSRLTLANAIQARQFGAEIHTRCELISAQKQGDNWFVQLKTDSSQLISIKAKIIINATGPWVNKTDDLLGVSSPYELTLVQGSHVVVPKLYEGEHAYFLQNQDKRIVFVIPYHDYSMIGTTDTPYKGDLKNITATAHEIDYLISSYNNYFEKKIDKRLIVNTWSGVRPLLTQKGKSPKHITRDYKLYLKEDGASSLSIYGGKITTYRQLAKEAIDFLKPYFNDLPKSKTAQLSLPNCTAKAESFQDYNEKIKQSHAWLPAFVLDRYLTNYGCMIESVLKDCHQMSHLGEHFNHGLYAQEIDYLIEHEWARTSEDILWRRTKLGLKFSQKELNNLRKYLKNTHNL